MHYCPGIKTLCSTSVPYVPELSLITIQLFCRDLNNPCGYEFYKFYYLTIRLVHLLILSSYHILTKAKFKFIETCKSMFEFIEFVRV
jgi:hypothetical protein